MNRDPSKNFRLVALAILITIQLGLTPRRVSYNYNELEMEGEGGSIILCDKVLHGSFVMSLYASSRE